MKQEGRNPAAIRKALDPLVEWYRQFKPDIHRVVVNADDYERIACADRSTLDRNGFQVFNQGKQGESVKYKGFDLVKRDPARV